MTLLAANFRYVRPSTLAEALTTMGEAGAMVLAGGQTLIPRLSAGDVAPSVLVDLGSLGELKRIETDGGALTIGSMVTLAQVIASTALRQQCPLLPLCAAKTATPSVRNRGTLVGNLAWADPASQLAVAALAIDAVLRIGRGSTFRRVPAAVFFAAPYRTTLTAGEMVTHLHAATVGERTGCGVADIAMRQNSRALATAAAVITFDSAERVTHAALAVGGCGDVPRRCSSAEAKLIGSSAADAPSVAASALQADPPPKGAGVLDADYAIAVLPVLLRKAVRDACAFISTR